MDGPLRGGPTELRYVLTMVRYTASGVLVKQIDSVDLFLQTNLGMKEEGQGLLQ